VNRTHLEHDRPRVAAVSRETRGLSLDRERHRRRRARAVHQLGPRPRSFVAELVAPPSRGDAHPRRGAAELPLQAVDGEGHVALVVGAAARAGGQVEPLDTGLVLPLHRCCRGVKSQAPSSGLPRRILKEPFSLAMIRPSFLESEVVTQIVQETRTAHRELARSRSSMLRATKRRSTRHLIRTPTT
jgi:hypothetical protein